MNYLLNFRHFFTILLILVSVCRGDDPSNAPLKRSDPRVGMISNGTDKVARLGKSDYWLLDRTGSHPQKQIAPVELDRERGECFTRQVLEAGGNWSFSSVRNLLFAGRSEEKKSRESMSYSCFEMKTNRMSGVLTTAER